MNNTYGTRATNMATHPGVPDLPHHRCSSAEVQEERHLADQDMANEKAKHEAILKHIVELQDRDCQLEIEACGLAPDSTLMQPPTSSSPRTPVTKRGRGRGQG